MTAGAVLCGGASRRMGTDKSVLAIDGVAMAERVARALESAGCAPIVLVGGEPGRLHDLRRPLLADRWPGEGPLGGVITALTEHRADTVVAACDLPWLDARSVGALLEAAGSEPSTTEAIVARTTRLEPALAWWSASCLLPLERLWGGGVRALHEAIDAISAVTVDVDPSALRNVNTPSDVADPGGTAG